MASATLLSITILLLLLLSELVASSIHRGRTTHLEAVGLALHEGIILGGRNEVVDIQVCVGLVGLLVLVEVGEADICYVRS